MRVAWTDIWGWRGVLLANDRIRLVIAPDIGGRINPEKSAWLAYDVRADGTITNGRVFKDAKVWMANKPGAPDGLAVDQAGNLFAAGPGGIYIFAPDGAHLGSIEIGVATSNCTWGDDGSVLYITADTAIYRIKLLTKGVGF